MPRLLLPTIALAFGLKGALNFSDWREAYFPFYGQFVYFLLGLWVYTIRANLILPRTLVASLLIAFTVFCLIAGRSDFESGRFVAHAVLISLLIMILPSAFTYFNGKVSTFLGNLSYGVYIVHFLVLELLLATGVILFPRKDLGELAVWAGALLVLAISAMLATLFEVSIQQRVDGWRRSFVRSRLSLASRTPTGSLGARKSC